ncbi:ImmA/IrrE family metallo-endopeptidase [Planococcus wigleyi]|uniref:ImmA/IrrE family metallo-endopeptidase n=1 Tax=Planococcus wigleyi TaxID=2762216 RepID=A0ABR8WA14_9BACL|nr:ImmA/IrrE family metallo-endopeptidase [Planococcus wigleyi]MBD8013844.1 ImmA/IrrE family metallo-endopeptidase [Planococcus wigleyi]
MNNTYNNLEEYIAQLLNRIDIFHPHELSIGNIYPRLGLTVHYIPHDSMAIAGNLFLDNRKNEEAQWQDFGHELCHALWHAGDQAILPLSMREYQEWKAENFSQHFCIPSLMLNKMRLPNNENEAIWMIMETFGVERWFAEKRLQQYLRNLIFGWEESR